MKFTAFKHQIKEELRNPLFVDAGGNQFGYANFAGIDAANTASEVIQVINDFDPNILSGATTLSDVFNRLKFTAFKHQIKEELGKAPFVDAQGNLLDAAAFRGIDAASTAAEVIDEINKLVQPLGLSLQNQPLGDGFADIPVQHLPLGIVVEQLNLIVNKHQAFDNFKVNVNAQLAKPPFNGNINIDAARTTAQVIEAINVLVPQGTEFALQAEGSGNVADLTIDQVLAQLQQSIEKFTQFKVNVNVQLANPPFNGNINIDPAPTTADVIQAINDFVPQGTEFALQAESGDVTDLTTEQVLEQLRECNVFYYVNK